MNNTTVKTLISGRSVRLVTAAALALLTMLLMSGSARADLQFAEVGVSLNKPPRIQEAAKLVTDPCCSYADFPYVNADGTFIAPDFERQAGSHPDMSVTVSFPLDAAGKVPLEAAKDVEFDLPAGMVGNPSNLPTCAPQDLLNSGGGASNCPLSSQIGIAEVDTAGPGGSTQIFRVGVFNISHGPEVPAKFGFNLRNVIGLVTARVRPGDYGISSGSFSISQGYALKSARLTFWGVPADPSHDWLRQGLSADLGIDFNTPVSERKPSQMPRVPFLTLPPACSGSPLTFKARVDSWENPGKFDTRTITADENGVPFTMERCDRIGFKPTVDVQPLAHTADAPTGVSVDVGVPQPQDPDGLASAHVRKVKMTFPEGVSVSPSSAAGLEACSPAQIDLDSIAPSSCPQSSVIGKVTIDTPLLEDPMFGDMILATPYDNPFGSLVALYISAKGPSFYLKLAGKVDLDPVTGQVTATFDENPQLPFSSLHVEFPGGSTASLATPPRCGTFDSLTALTSWNSAIPVELRSPMTIDQGCTPGPNAPSFTAGTSYPLAGEYAPFAFHATRADRTPYLSRVDTSLPPGLLANIGSVAKCGEADANAGTCPASSRVGSTSTLVGPGAQPLPAKGDVYLTGPYKGAPYGMSIAVPTKGQAGPFDLGIVVVRAGIYVDPTDTHVTVKSDPLPTIIKGIPLRMRQVNLEIDRPEFTLNPTNCAPKTISGTFEALDAAASHQALPFQVAGCGELGFGPSLQISMKGAMKRSGNPALTAILKAPKGDANIGATTVILPRSSFIDNEHVNNPCTRPQFAAGTCPPSSIMGTATAYSPLLDQPLTGPVYFKANGEARELPDLVADLHGPIDVEVTGFIDSVVKGEISRVRTRFLSIPDAPVSKFVLKMKGGKRGLIENSANLCAAPRKATVRMTGQNGKTHNFAQKIVTSCAKKSKKGK